MKGKPTNSPEVGLLLAIVCLAGCDSQSLTVPPPKRPIAIDAKVAEVFGGADGFAPVDKPGRVAAYRVSDRRVFDVATNELDHANDNNAQTATFTVKAFDGYPVTSGPVEVDLQIADELADVLGNPRAYEQELTQECKFQPGVAIRFVNDSGVTDIVLCFTCGHMMILKEGREGWLKKLDARAMGQLYLLMGRIFPDDKAFHPTPE